MAERNFTQLLDNNGHPTGIFPLKDSHDIDGTATSAPSQAIEGKCVRILSLDNALRFEIGDNPEATANSAAINAGHEIYQPIQSGQKVAVLGGKANITTVGI